MNYLEGRVFSGLAQGSDILEINQSADLSSSDFEETDPSGVRNKFRIYRAKSASPPLSLRADTFDLNFSAGIKEILDSTLGVLNPGTGLIQTASALGESAQVKIIGEGHDAEAEVQFSPSANPQLIISRGGMGFVTEPTLQILNDNNESILTIDPSSIIEESATHSEQPIAKLLDSEKWIRGSGYVQTVACSQRH